MLTENSSSVLMRAALAVLAECEDDLLQLHDFEDLITYLKVQHDSECLKLHSLPPPTPDPPFLRLSHDL